LSWENEAAIDNDGPPLVLYRQASLEGQALFLFDLFIGKQRPAFLHARPSGACHMRTADERGADEVTKFPDH
jgi:hypothetical protein